MLDCVSNLTNCKRKKGVARARHFIVNYYFKSKIIKSAKYSLTKYLLLSPKLLNQLSIRLLNIYF